MPDLYIVSGTDDDGTLVGLVAEGVGAAIVPRLVVNPRNPAVAGLKFGTRIPQRVIVLAWHRDRSSTIREIARSPSGPGSGSCS